MLHRPGHAWPVVVADWLLAGLALLLADLLRRAVDLGKPLDGSETLLNLWVILAAVGSLTLVMLALRAYETPQLARWPTELRHLLVGWLLAALVLAGLLYLSFRDLPRLLFLYFVGLELILLVLGRLGLRLVVGAWPGRRPRRVLIVGATELGQSVAAAVRRHRRLGLELIGFLDDRHPEAERSFADGPVLGPPTAALAVIADRQVDELLFALPLHGRPELLDLVFRLQRLPVQVRVVPDLYDIAFARTRVEDLGGVPVIGLREPAISGVSRAVKRAFDLVVAGVSVVVTAPLMLAIALAIRLDSPGGALFRQPRVGENCRVFGMYKFRTMAEDAETQWRDVAQERNGAIVHKRPDDPRITRVGRWLRRTSLDELPNLFNVLRGEMSLVGPRPEMPYLVELYADWQYERFSVPPGMTGWWQINGRAERLMHLHTEDDLYYIQNYSLWLDLRILWKTVGVVVRRHGAY